MYNFIRELIEFRPDTDDYSVRWDISTKDNGYYIVEIIHRQYNHDHIMDELRKEVKSLFATFVKNEGITDLVDQVIPETCNQLKNYTHRLIRYLG